jgi:hypothetical protein
MYSRRSETATFSGNIDGSRICRILVRYESDDSAAIAKVDTTGQSPRSQPIAAHDVLCYCTMSRCFFLPVRTSPVL